MGSLVIVFVMLAVVIVSTALSLWSKRFHYKVQCLFGLGLFSLSIYLLLILYSLISVIRGGVESVSATSASMSLMDFVNDAGLWIACIFPLLVSGVWMLVASGRRSASRSFRRLMLVGLVSAGLVYAATAAYINKARDAAYDAVVVGDSEARLLETFGVSPTYAAEQDSAGVRVKIIWFNNQLLWSSKKWIFQINQQGIVESKFQ